MSIAFSFSHLLTQALISYIFIMNTYNTKIKTSSNRQLFSEKIGEIRTPEVVISREKSRKLFGSFRYNIEHQSRIGGESQNSRST